MNELDSYRNTFFPDLPYSNHASFSSSDLNLIDLANFLHEISILNKKYQEIDYSEDFILKLNDYEKTKFYENVISVHKKLTHFILKNKSSNETA